MRRTDQFARLVDKRPIDAPRVDADRHRLNPVLRRPIRRRPQAANDLPPDSGHVPMQTGRQPHRLVRKAMHFLQPQPAAVEHANNHAPRLGAEINSNIRPRHAPLFDSLEPIAALSLLQPRLSEIKLVDVRLVERERLTEQDVVALNFNRSQSPGLAAICRPA